MFASFYSAVDGQIVGTHHAKPFDPTRVIAVLASSLRTKV
jgi:hypothetical protein